MPTRDRLQPELESELWSTYRLERSVVLRNKIFDYYYQYVLRMSGIIYQKISVLDRRSVDQDDILSLSCICTLALIESYDPIHGIDFLKYLRLMLYRKILDELRTLRSKRKYGEVPDGAFKIDTAIVGLGKVQLPIVSPRDRESALISDAIDFVFRGLPPRECLIAKLWYLEDMRQSEISRVIGISQARISQLMRFIRERMRERATMYLGYSPEHVEGYSCLIKDVA